jgi:hypothetical protein
MSDIGEESVKEIEKKKTGKMKPIHVAQPSNDNENSDTRSPELQK